MNLVHCFDCESVQNKIDEDKQGAYKTYSQEGGTNLCAFLSEPVTY